MARRRSRIARRPMHKIAGVCDACGGWTELAWSDRRWRWVCADCGSHKVIVPAPGSADAVLEGCTCEPAPNNKGHVEPDSGWVKALGCPVHDPFPTEGTA